VSRGTSARRTRPPRTGRTGGSGGKGGTGSGGGTAILQQPLARIVLVVVFLGVLIFVITQVVSSCQRNQLVDSYKSYVNDATAISSESHAEGQKMIQILSNPKGSTPTKLVSDLQVQAAQAQALVKQAQGLDPPGKMKAADRAFVNALQYRANGLSSLAQLLPSAIQSNRETSAANIAERMKRFLASDVIYSDQFIGPAAQALKDDNIQNVDLPDPNASAFLPQVKYVLPAGAAELADRVRQVGGSPGGGLHGLALVKTVAEPDGVALSDTQTNVITTSDKLKWAVDVQNQGNFAEQKVAVTATFAVVGASPSESQKQTVTIPSLAAKATTTVSIPGPVNPSVDQDASLKVVVATVPGEKTGSNNVADYPIRLKLP